MSNPIPGEPSSDSGWELLPPSLPPVGILAGLSTESLANLASYGVYASYKDGTEIIDEGREQDRLYILVEGQLQISASVSGQEMSLAKVEPGECIGELAVLVPGPASATVRAIADSVLWSMDADSLRSYISDHPGGGGVFLMGMAQILSTRLHEANRRITENNITPAFVPPRMEAVITAPSASQVSFFEMIKKSLAGEQKVKISTEIKL